MWKKSADNKKHEKLPRQYAMSWTFFFYIFFFFFLILYVPVNNFSVMSGQVFLGWTHTKQG